MKKSESLIFNNSVNKISEKHTINLVVKEKKVNNPYAFAAAIAALVILLSLFTRFAVVSPLSKLAAAEKEVSDLQEQVNSLKQYNEKYQEIQSEYLKYSDSGLNSDELSVIDRTKILALIDSKIRQRADISSVVITENTVTLKISGVSLTGLSEIISSLYSDNMVSFVTVSNADSSEESENIFVSMTITLNSEEIGNISEGGE